MCIFLWKKTSWKQREYDKILLVMDSGKHGFRVFGNTMEKWLFFKRWNWAFVYFFFAKILAYLMIFFKVECASKGPVRTLKNHEIHPKNWLKMKKSPLFNLPLTHLSTVRLNFGYLFRHYFELFFAFAHSFTKCMYPSTFMTNNIKSLMHALILLLTYCKCIAERSLQGI